MDNKTYRALDLLNFSKIKRVLQLGSYREFVKDQESFTENDSIILGNVVHDLYLEETLRENYIFETELASNRRAKEYQDWKKEQELAGKTIIKEEVKSKALKMLQNLQANKLLKSLRKQGKNEVEKVFLTDERKGKLDLVIETKTELIIVDIKTTRDSIQEFQRTLFYNYYHAQLAYYGDLICSEKKKRHILVAVESETETHNVACIELSPGHIQNGRKEYARMIEFYNDSVLKAKLNAEEFPEIILLETQEERLDKIAS